MKYVRVLSTSLLVAAAAMIGCSQPANTPAPKPNSGGTPAANEAAPHVHGTGPNGGVVFDLGSHHTEFTVDHPKQECYILFVTEDKATAQPVQVAASEFTLSIKETKTEDGKVVPAMTITMTPQDAADGKASKFVGKDPGIGNVADFEGTVVGEIDGKPAQGSFKE